MLTRDQIQEHLYSAVISDALDAAGFRDQVLSVSLLPMTGGLCLFGRCRTTEWEDIDFEDPRPYELELKAVDECEGGDVLIAAAGGSMRSGIWGELLSTAARNRGCVGALVDGAVRDVDKMRSMDFTVFAAALCPRDSLHRQRVIAVDTPVVIGGVTIHRGDFIFADEDGTVVVPEAEIERILDAAWQKVHAENAVRDDIRSGMSATEVFAKHGVL
ncbi:MAG: RraA family protein [Verrucomicrobiales bacterium]|nr:RraA family protein [Verrucomicrobiales bacterium]